LGRILKGLGVEKYSHFKAAAEVEGDWHDRSEFWLLHRPAVRGRSKKYLYREPLILCGHGAHIRIDRASLLIRNGFTHYPQKREEIRLFPGDADLPDRIVMLDGSGGITFDALTWMAEQRITLVRLNWRGEVSFVGNNSGNCANWKMVNNQSTFRGTRRSLEYSRKLLEQKIGNSISTLENVFPQNNNRELAVSRLSKWNLRIRKPGKSLSLSTLLGIEGGAAAAYFGAWQGLPLKWVGLHKRPIPKSWLAIAPRTMVWRKTGVNARHPINSMLNYGYAMLASQLRGEIVAAGLDPSIGFMHGNSSNRIPLVYDLMEPLRPIVDKCVLQFALENIFSPEDCTINRVGACRLNPQLARAVAKRIQIAGDSGAIVREYMKQFGLS